MGKSVDNQANKYKKQLPLIIIACLSLGLAPFFPEPHLWGKIKWIIGGANGMEFIDWLDLLLHGSPWFLLIYYLVKIN